MDIVPFDEGHAEGCAALVAEASRAARDVEPLLPAVLEDVSAVALRVQRLGGLGLGVTALDGDDVVGFLAAFPYELWGRPGAYVPEWGHGVADPALIEAVYAGAAERWAAAGRVTHAASIWAHDQPSELAWHRLGFGRVLTHSLRPLGTPNPSVELRRAGLDDLDVLIDLDHGLWSHLAAPPTLRVHPESDPDDLEALLGDEDRPVWLAEGSDGVAGFVGAALDHDDSPSALDSPEVMHVTAAFVRPERRSGGVARSLVDMALGWGAGRGCDRATVEFESANVEGARAWRGLGFSPVVHVIVRRTR